MDCTTRLPPELLGAAFGHLKQPDVLRAAAVCGRWRAEARHSRNYYPCIKYGAAGRFCWHTNGLLNFPVIVGAKRFSHAMYEAADNEGIRRLGVFICLAFPVGDVDNWCPEYENLEAVVRAFILPSLTKCMKKICRLDIHVTSTYFAALSPALCQPAFRGRGWQG